MKTTELITMLSRDATHAAPPSQKWLQVALLLAALAVTLGLTLVELARARALPVVINIRDSDRCLFHAAFGAVWSNTLPMMVYLA